MNFNRKTSVKLNTVFIPISTGFKCEVTNGHADYLKWNPFWLLTYLLTISPTALRYFGLWVYITSTSFDEKCRVNWNVAIFLIILISYWWSIGTEPLSVTVCEMFPFKYIWDMTLTFSGHVTSPGTWAFDTPGAMSYRCFIVTERLSPTVFKIFGPNTCSRTHERTNQQTWRIAIPSGGGNKIILLAPLPSEISWLAFGTPLKTNRIHHNMRGVKMTPASRRSNKIGLPVEGLTCTAHTGPITAQPVQ